MLEGAEFQRVYLTFDARPPITPLYLRFFPLSPLFLCKGSNPIVEKKPVWAQNFNMATQAVDYCAVPAAPPPAGRTSNLVDPADLSMETLVVGFVLTAISLVFLVGRILINRKRLAMADCMDHPRGQIRLPHPYHTKDKGSKGEFSFNYIAESTMRLILLL